MDISLGRDIALIWLSLLCFIALIIPLALFFVLVRYMNSAHKFTLNTLHKVHDQATVMRNKTEQVAERAVQPVIRVQKGVSRTKSTLQSIASPRSDENWDKNVRSNL